MLCNHSTTAASVQGAPKGAVGPLTQPKWPPAGVMTREKSGFSWMAFLGMQRAGAMGSVCACNLDHLCTQPLFPSRELLQALD